MVVGEDAIRAQVMQIKNARVALDARVMRGNIATRIGQHPIVIGRATDRAALRAEPDLGAIAYLAALFTDDAQSKRHERPSEGRRQARQPRRAPGHIMPWQSSNATARTH